MMILDQIVASKLHEIEEARNSIPESELQHACVHREPTRDFAGSLMRPSGVSIIAEVKKASPSSGVIRENFDPVAIAKIYDAHGTAAISVLTDHTYFQGSLDALIRVRKAVGCPVLRKDFVIDGYQLWEARAAGADAVLLIAECLEGSKLAELYRQARELGLHVLMELHDAEQLDRVLRTDCPVIGINNRDLRNFQTSINRTFELMPHIPRDRIVVSESGIRSAKDLIRLGEVGVRAVLVGETLMRAPDIGAALDELRR